ncbi:hypothetical protein H6F88_17970 [Oculatella sp. FACHB-28]|uniref:hypothetical protein n=1 Tax=Oculatella sp. FACHB-28 TaxID=2692845 RepID=UPI001684CFD6|nr:hypothetical protein [Oculatella sp. FACHB-28]MBD2057883.1 hypothetical protein [Oculatella sp. FACHB-28]
MSTQTGEKFTQLELTLHVVKSTEVDGLEMGVLNDGTPFLTGRGLAKVCGVSHVAIIQWANDYSENGGKLRSQKITELLAAQGFEGGKLFVKTIYKDRTVNAYPDTVCMAFLEYYAFEAERYCTEQAKNNYRILARKSLRDFIYKMTGYDPMSEMLNSWRHFHDRLLLNPVPVGYFSIFRETADIVIASIRKGLIVDDHTVPDISVGQVWSKYWSKCALSQKYGNRAKYPHAYPDYFPQAKANDVIEAFIYPLQSLGEFRQWLQTEYLPGKFPSYLKKKVQQGVIPANRLEPLLASLEPVRADLIKPSQM